MANEPFFLGRMDTNVRSITIPSGTAIPEDTLMTYGADPDTGAVHTGTEVEFPAGIAAMEKDSTDASTTISIRTKGRYDMVCDGVVTQGHWVVMGRTPNRIKDAGTTLSGVDLFKLVGVSTETGSDGERIITLVDIR